MFTTCKRLVRYLDVLVLDSSRYIQILNIYQALSIIYWQLCFCSCGGVVATHHCEDAYHYITNCQKIATIIIGGPSTRVFKLSYERNINAK